MNRLITRNKIEHVIKLLPTNKSPGPDELTLKFYQTYTEKLIPIRLKLFQRLKKGTLPKTFYVATIPLISKPDKDATKKENYRLLPLRNIDTKILNKILGN